MKRYDPADQTMPTIITYIQSRESQVSHIRQHTTATFRHLLRSFINICQDVQVYRKIQVVYHERTERAHQQKMVQD